MEDRGRRRRESEGEIGFIGREGRGRVKLLRDERETQRNIEERKTLDRKEGEEGKEIMIERRRKGREEGKKNRILLQ